MALKNTRRTEVAAGGEYMLTDKVVLITGGTGSFGKTMVHHLLDKGCQEVRILSRDEEKQDAMRTDLNSTNIKFYIGDIRDRASVDDAMQGVDMVFHAAALKQVPSCEFFPMQAVQTNIVGSHNVLLSAVEHKVASVVCLSTDKAVMPVNAMGMSKAMMEKVAQSVSRNLGETDTIVSCVRYGNVMCSRGSVIPLFIKQIKAGKPITITNPKMTRFLMPLREAVNLVEFAFINARQGDLFVKKAPASTVADLAEALIQLFNANDQIINIIGTRHGEKLFETLASTEELVRSEDMGDYYRVSMDARDLNYGKFFTEGDIEESEMEDYHSHNTYRLSIDEIKELLLSLPEVREELDGWVGQVS
ncbi:UDP-glucose 4-epimerase [Mariprofundus ferrinatatus]|uniref:UDP-glucose 4-epimerase n=1 Tax=Mariprofundus ferrinatatus TaxID=1921087 RepID=A0A2K8L3Z0_9PROT|nr:SDR family NAD(P)-dependent oxidoreductase [Mariprofundus ferrinatatus]ATX82007.1 UDP-glucose 4-epimerase [Mariprofundus ferrinatatus]